MSNFSKNIEEIRFNKNIRYTRSGKIRIDCVNKNKFLPIFLWSVLILTIVSFILLDIPWLKLFSRFGDLGLIFWKLAHFDFSKIDLIAHTMMETISITVLSTIYSIFAGIFFAMLACETVFKQKWLSVFIKSFFTFLRAVPTPIWVLLMMVCLGMGCSAGIAGLCIHTTAFFVRAFVQSFESIPEETIEALEATGIGRIGVFLNAVFPSSLSKVVAWTGMRFEINFGECTSLGMVGAGGIGFVISNNIEGYNYGTAGLAIFLVFVFAFIIERLFVLIKGKIN